MYATSKTKESMKNYITQIKRKKTDGYSDVTAIITGALPGYRIKSLGPRPLFKIDDDIILNKTVENLHKNLPNCDIILTIGYQADKIIKNVDNVRLVENQLFEDTNESEELRLAFNVSYSNKILVIDSDILFDSSILDKINLNVSSVFTYNNVENNEEISISVEGGEAHIFTYGHKSKWAHISYITNHELLLCRKILENRQKNQQRHFFEILNDIIEYGGKFKTIQIDKITRLDHSFYENNYTT